MQYKEASLKEKIQLKFHLLVCKTCSVFSKKNTQLTSLCEKANLHSLTESEKLKMKNELNNKV
ncbi:hypothetical protein SAMN04488514_11438 [Kriegella aquimaris]|uniref:Uncharacterized protein n=1 Tax=Kriegella aquimaris TaxID=192904 RepID=A0A1G9VSY5_9FLAO|nr:hypothetical protein SAMN04488514_11438 [Kriegella aquimaris]